MPLRSAKCQQSSILPLTDKQTDKQNYYYNPLAHVRRSAHASEGYSSHLVCRSVILSLRRSVDLSTSNLSDSLVLNLE